MEQAETIKFLKDWAAVEVWLDSFAASLNLKRRLLNMMPHSETVGRYFSQVVEADLKWAEFL